MIPQKKSSQWIGIFIFYIIVVFISLLITRSMLGSVLLVRNIFGLLILSTGSALLPCIGGFLGKQIFFIIYTLSGIVAILYMFYVVLGNTSPGWGDLTSIVGYIYIVAVGAILALVMEIISSFVKLNKSRKK